MPAAIPVTVPVDAPTVAMAGIELNQVPPGDVASHVSDEPTHNGVVPTMFCGVAAPIVMVSVAVLVHPPAATVYVNIEVPAAIPITTPVAGSMDAMPGL